jgi:hypothetical protein
MFLEVRNLEDVFEFLTKQHRGKMTKSPKTFQEKVLSECCSTTFSQGFHLLFTIIMRFMLKTNKAFERRLRKFYQILGTSLSFYLSPPRG